MLNFFSFGGVAFYNSFWVIMSFALSVIADLKSHSFCPGTPRGTPRDKVLLDGVVSAFVPFVLHALTGKILERD